MDRGAGGDLASRYFQMPIFSNGSHSIYDTQPTIDSPLKCYQILSGRHNCRTVVIVIHGAISLRARKAGPNYPTGIVMLSAIFAASIHRLQRLGNRRGNPSFVYSLIFVENTAGCRSLQWLERP